MYRLQAFWFYCIVLSKNRKTATKNSLFVFLWTWHRRFKFERTVKNLRFLQHQDTPVSHFHTTHNLATMTDSNNNNNNNNASNLPYYLRDGTGDRQSSSSRSVLGLLDLVDIAALNQSMNHGQASVGGGHDLVQTLLLRHLLSSNTSVNQTHDPRPPALFGYAAASGLDQPALSNLTLLNLLNSNSSTSNSVLNQHSLTARHDTQLGIPPSNFPVTSASSNDLMRYVVASQNNSLRELSLRLNGVSDAPSGSTPFLALPSASHFYPGNMGAATTRTQPLFEKVHHKGEHSSQSPLFNPSPIPNDKPRSQQTNDATAKTNSEGDSIIPVFTEDEKYVLSEYQSFLRQQMVYVETKSAAERKGGKTQGRNKPITAHQVGVMCIHCAKVPYDARPRGAVYYPATLEGVYQAAQNMSKNHFEVRRCQAIPDHVQNRLIELKRTKSVNVGTGKDYWKKSAENIGICEVDSRLFFKKSLVLSKG